MKSELKCPFCQTELDYDEFGWDYSCSNPSCQKSLGILSGTEKLWQALIQAKQDLETISAKYAQSQKTAEIATKALKQIVCADKDGKPLKGVVSCWLDMDELNKCIEQIEHKE